VDRAGREGSGKRPPLPGKLRGGLVYHLLRRALGEGGRRSLWGGLLTGRVDIAKGRTDGGDERRKKKR